MNEERWLPVVGFEGLYEVSDRGRVRSVDRVVRDSIGRWRAIDGKVRSVYVDEKGRDRVTLVSGGRRYGRRVRKMVADAFGIEVVR